MAGDIIGLIISIVFVFLVIIVSELLRKTGISMKNLLEICYILG